MDTALETHNDLPAFVPEKDLRTALTAAQHVARQRDELANENARLRREVESALRSRREIEEGTAGGEGVSKRLRLLREALVRKDQEILNLKSYQQGHAKQLKEAQDVAERLRRERGELEDRLRTRDGAFAAIERERENLSRALDGARRDEARAAQVVMEADSVVGEWRTAYDATNRELDEARRQLAELRSAWQTLASDRQRVAEAHAAEIATVRSESAAAVDRLSREMERALTDATSRYDAAREAHAIALRAAEDDHADQLAEERELRSRVEGDLASVRERLAQAESARNWADGELAAARTRLEAAEASLNEITRDLQEVHAREIEALTDAHQKETENLVAAFDAELTAIRAVLGGDRASTLPRDVRELGEQFVAAETRARAQSAELEERKARVAQLEAELAELQRDREDACSALVDSLAERDAKQAGLVRELGEQHGEELRECESRYAMALDAAQRYFEEALTAQRESHEAEIEGLKDTLLGDDARVADLERDLDSAREALGHYAAESAGRLAAAERAAADASAARDRYARKLVQARARIQELTTHGAPEVPEQLTSLTRIVGEVMSVAVVQTAAAASFRAGRAVPDMTDVEEAISLVGDGLPDACGDLLWGARDTLLQRAKSLHLP